MFMMFNLFLLTTSLLTTSTTKFCIDCKHYIPPPKGLLPVNGKCSRYPISVAVDVDYLISGRGQQEYKFCSTARTFDSMCGLKGKNFEPFPK